MRRTLHPLFVMLASLTHQELARQIAYLKKENEILRAREFQAWYNYERPHSSVNHLPPGDQTMSIVGNQDSEKDVVYETRLGGLLKSYTRRAA